MSLLTPVAFQTDVPPSPVIRRRQNTKTKRCIKKCSARGSARSREDRLEKKLKKTETVVRKQQDAIEELLRANKELREKLDMAERKNSEKTQSEGADPESVCDVKIAAPKKKLALTLNVTEEGLEKPCTPRPTPARKLAHYRPANGLYFRSEAEERFAKWFTDERQRRHLVKHPSLVAQMIEATPGPQNVSFNSRTHEEITNEFEATTVPFEYTSEDEAMFGWC
eukprot:TRINITY_DN2299_c3_g2_i1.p1 TRINITY_DN2299_c3_g2~~TRINITY_DN2299_c3_g2_i1.p1  ORF type:complete len:224 (+),score=55.61 TRINITY_DN2299_c3_g2_i1:56-727(+)